MGGVTVANHQAGLGMLGHHAAIVGLLYLPILVFVVVLAMKAGSLAGIGMARRFEQNYLNSLPSSHLAALAMAITAAVHLALAPEHFTEDRILGTLFGLDGIAFGAVAAGVYLINSWRMPALALVAASLLAYAFYILSGREAVDAVGIFTKVIELSVAVLILFGTRSNQILGRLTPAIATEASL